MATDGTEIGRLIVRLMGDSSHYVSMLKQAESVSVTASARIRSAINTVGKHLFIPAAAGAALIVKSVKEAADAQETMSKFEAVFKEQSAAVKTWAADTAAATNRSKHELHDFLASTQDLFVPLGFASDEARELSQTVTQLAVDLGSFQNRNTADVVRDLQSALTGEVETMKKYGVVINEARLKQELLNQGLDPKFADESQKAFARLNIILAGTAAAHGDAERTAGSFSNVTRGLLADFKDLRIEMATQALPVLTHWAEQLREIGASSKTAGTGTGWLSDALMKVSDVAHALGIGFKAAQSLVTGVLASMATDFGNFVNYVIGLVNKIPGIDIGETTMLNTLGQDLRTASDKQWAEFQNALMGKTPSEEITHAIEQQAAVAANTTNGVAAAQERVTSTLKEQHEQQQKLKQIEKEREQLYSEMAGKAHSLLMDNLTPIQALKHQINDIRSLMNANALDRDAAESAVSRLIGEFAEKGGVSKISGGAAVEAGTREAYSLTNFGEEQRTQEKDVRAMLAETRVSVKTEKQILAAIKSLNVGTKPDQLVSIPGAG